MKHLEALIEKYYADPAAISPQEMKPVIEEVIEALNQGELRVATRIGPGEWQVNAWIKKAIFALF